MTVCVGIAQEGNVFMGADSTVTGGYLTFKRALPKIFRNGSFLFGVAGSAKTADFMHYAEFPKPGPNVREFMSVSFPEMLRQLFEKMGRLHRENEIDTHDSALLVGVRGTLWCGDANFSFSEMLPAEYAIGSGSEIAMGALYATRGKHPRDRIRMALKAAGTYGSNIGPPYVLKTLKA